MLARMAVSQTAPNIPRQRRRIWRAPGLGAFGWLPLPRDLWPAWDLALTGERGDFNGKAFGVAVELLGRRIHRSYVAERFAVFALTALGPAECMLLMFAARAAADPAPAARWVPALAAGVSLRSEFDPHIQAGLPGIAGEMLADAFRRMVVPLGHALERAGAFDEARLNQLAAAVHDEVERLTTRMHASLARVSSPRAQRLLAHRAAARAARPLPFRLVPRAETRPRVLPSVERRMQAERNGHCRRPAQELLEAHGPRAPDEEGDADAEPPPLDSLVRLADTPEGRQRIDAELERLRAWCRANGIPWPRTWGPSP